jgi:hypothetical protein
MDFEWDESKRVANKRKHGVDFNGLDGAFADPYRIEAPEYVGNEGRWQLIAMAPAGLLYVVNVERRRDVIRIISARRATSREARTYYSSQTDRR